MSVSPSTSHWLGGMFSPEAFITATRQQTAQSKGWSLEELELFLDVNIDGGMSIGGSDEAVDTILRGLVLENATWAEGTLRFSSDLRCRLSSSLLRWRRRQDTAGELEKSVIVPVYLSESRKTLVTEVRLVLSVEVPRLVLAQRGVAIVLSG